MGTIALLTSGGDAPGMNNAVRGVVRTAVDEGLNVIGFKRGFEGLVDNDYTELTSRSVGHILEEGGTMLGTYRSEEFKTDAGQRKALDNLNDLEVDGLITIGGDGTFRGARVLDEKWRGQVLGIPATIDNDIGGTEYCLGFDTAVSTALNAIDHIRDTATSHERTFIIEVMGRNAGHIALTAGLAGGAEEILVPEVEYEVDSIAGRIQEARSKGKLHYIIVLAEGAGRAYKLSDTLEEKSTFQTRVVVLGHIQRGGDPSAWDRVGGSKMGYHSVQTFLNDKTGLSVGIHDGEKKLTPFDEAIEGKNLDKNDLKIATTLSR